MKQRIRKQRKEMVLDQAATWMSRLQASGHRAWDDPEFLSWISQSDDHRLAFADISVLWYGLDGLADSDGVSAPAFGSQPVRRRRLWMPSLAAAALIVIAVALVPWLGRTVDRWRADEWTAEQEVRVVQMADGSTLQLGPDSAIQWRDQNLERGVRLLRGEAFFTVTRDVAKVFSVALEGARIEVLGTRFGVSTTDGIRVGVTDGRVALLPASGPGVELAAGDQARLTDSGVEMDPQDPTTFFSWTSGQLVLRDWPLAAALQRIEPFAGVTIVLLDSDAGARKISSVIDLKHARRGIETLAEQLQLDVISLPGLRILH